MLGDATYAQLSLSPPPHVSFRTTSPTTIVIGLLVAQAIMTFIHLHKKPVALLYSDETQTQPVSPCYSLP